MVDWAEILLKPKYTVLGVTAAIEIDSLSDAFDVTAIDKTAGVRFGDDPNYQDVASAVFVRDSEIVAQGITRADLRGGHITLNAKTWRIEQTRAVPVPDGGEADGEIMLILMEE